MCSQVRTSGNQGLCHRALLDAVHDGDEIAGVVRIVTEAQVMVLFTLESRRFEGFASIAGRTPNVSADVLSQLEAGTEVTIRVISARDDVFGIPRVGILDLA